MGASKLSAKVFFFKVNYSFNSKKCPNQPEFTPLIYYLAYIHKIERQIKHKHLFVVQPEVKSSSHLIHVHIRPMLFKIYVKPFIGNLAMMCPPKVCLSFGPIGICWVAFGRGGRSNVQVVKCPGL